VYYGCAEKYWNFFCDPCKNSQTCVPGKTLASSNFDGRIVLETVKRNLEMTYSVEIDQERV